MARSLRALLARFAKGSYPLSAHGAPWPSRRGDPPHRCPDNAAHLLGEVPGHPVAARTSSLCSLTMKHWLASRTAATVGPADWALFADSAPDHACTDPQPDASRAFSYADRLPVRTDQRPAPEQM